MTPDRQLGRTTRKLVVAAALAVAVIGNADAKTVTYGCRFPDLPPPDGSYRHALKIDFTKKTITWKGYTFRNLKEVYDDGSGKDCAKACFSATRRDGEVRIDTATQGFATLTISDTRPGGDGVSEAECEMVLDR
jgi:hypothetical protein